MKYAEAHFKNATGAASAASTSRPHWQQQSRPSPPPPSAAAASSSSSGELSPPYVEILEQPASHQMRFRYECESQVRKKPAA